jgi:hypothetical protein
MQGGSEQSELLQRLVSRIDPDDFADRVLDSYWSRRDLVGPREARRHAHMWVRWNLDVVVRWLVDSRPPTEAELDVLRSRARQQAQDGVPVDFVPGNFRRGARFAWNAALEIADEAERVALLETADLLFEFVDRVSRIYAEAHADAERLAPIAIEERLARGLLTRLARDEPPTAEDVDLAARLGIRLDGTFRPFVVALAGASGAAHLDLAEGLRGQACLAVSEGRWVVAVSRVRPDHPGLYLPEGSTIAEGDLTAREQLGAVLIELRMLVDVALSHGHTGVVEPNRYLVELLLRTGPRVAAQIRHQVYGPLRAHPELARSLDCLVEHNFNRQRAAAALPAHRNTLRDRLHRVAELTGLDLENPDDRGLAWLAHLCAPDPRGPADRVPPIVR